MAPAETILEAIARASDLTIRGIEGIIAEATFVAEVVPSLEQRGWRGKPISGDQAYDALLSDSTASADIRVQVKMQRRKERRPLRADQVERKCRWPAEYFVVETQKTRAGKDSAGADTRPYRFGSFDVLAVSMGASQGRWNAFLYTVERWLLPSADPTRILKYQPVPPAPTRRWTDDFLTCVAWHRSGGEGSVADDITH